METPESNWRWTLELLSIKLNQNNCGVCGLDSNQEGWLSVQTKWNNWMIEIQATCDCAHSFTLMAESNYYHIHFKPILKNTQWLFFNKGVLSTGERMVFSTDGAETTGQSQARIKLNLWFTLYTNINWKWIIDLNVRAQIIKLSQENLSVNLCDLCWGNGFLDMTPRAQALKQRNR